jgi:fructose 1,6-bisphosphate aldolase/phosphatase
MTRTLSVIKADIGGFVGHSGMHPDVMSVLRANIGKAINDNLLIDGQVHSCGDDAFLIMSHDNGQDNTEVHEFAWDSFIDGTEVAKKLHLYGAGQDLLVDAFSGNIKGAGPGSAELEYEERPSEPVIVFMGDKTSAGSFNLPFYKMFADPFNTAGLVISESLHKGFAFEVHDVKEHKKIILNTPEEMYDLLIFIGSPSRYAIKRIISRTSNSIACVSSTDKLSEIAGKYVGKDDPAAIATAWTVEGFMRGSHYGPWMPVSLDQSNPSRFDGPPRVVALGFQLADGKLIGPRDMFDDPSFDNARTEANDISDYLRKHGPFEPHRLPLDEMEYTTMPTVANKLSNRWSEV